MTFKDKTTFENKLVWYFPDFYPDVIGREGSRDPLDQSHRGKSLIFTAPICF